MSLNNEEMACKSIYSKAHHRHVYLLRSRTKLLNLRATDVCSNSVKSSSRIKCAVRQRPE